MRKYVVPIVALAGIALLIPSANAVDLIIKSRAIPAGGAGSLPVIVSNAPAGGLWGIDAGLTFSAATVTAGSNAFTPNSTGPAPYDAAKDVAISGNTFVGSGAQPNVYFGYVRGATAMAEAGADTAVGLLKLSVTPGTPANTVVNLTAASYNVLNTGQPAGSTRAGATAATVSGSNVVSETVSLVDAVSEELGAVPLHKVATTVPGDANGNGDVNPADLAIAKDIVLGKAAARTDFRVITLDVAPANGYVPGTNIGGTAGLGYGNMVVNPGDLAAMKSRLALSNPNFPVAE